MTDTGYDSTNERTGRSALWFAGAILLPMALLTGSLLGGQIARQCGMREVFVCMDRSITATMGAYDAFGFAKTIQTMVERANGD